MFLIISFRYKCPKIDEWFIFSILLVLWKVYRIFYSRQARGRSWSLRHDIYALSHLPRRDSVRQGLSARTKHVHTGASLRPVCQILRGQVAHLRSYQLRHDVPSEVSKNRPFWYQHESHGADERLAQGRYRAQQPLDEFVHLFVAHYSSDVCAKWKIVILINIIFNLMFVFYFIICFLKIKHCVFPTNFENFKRDILLTTLCLLRYIDTIPKYYQCRINVVSFCLLSNFFIF